MAKFVLRRLLQALVVLILVSFLDFMLIHFIPGDPVRQMLGTDASEAQVRLIRHQLGLDQPVFLQYVHWLDHLLHGNLGRSITLSTSVADLIRSRILVTFEVGIVALVFSVVVGIPLGILAAVRRGKALDSLVTVLANLGMSVPIFWLGVLGIYVFALRLGWLPVEGYTSPFVDFGQNVRQMVMPCILMALPPLAVFARQTRASVLEVIAQDYIRTARANGLPERTVLLRHALKNAVIPIITTIGLQLPVLVGGSALVETVFNLPGMGRLLVQSVFGLDIPVVQGCVMLIATFVILMNLLVDISYGYLNPRIRFR